MQKKKWFQFLLKGLITICLFCVPGSLLYNVVPIFITLLLYKSVLYDLMWISIFLRVLWSWMFEFSSTNWWCFRIKHITSIIYSETKVRIFSSLNSCLQDVLVLAATVDLITCFWIWSILAVNSPPCSPHPCSRLKIIYQTGEVSEIL